MVKRYLILLLPETFVNWHRVKKVFQVLLNRCDDWLMIDCLFSLLSTKSLKSRLRFELVYQIKIGCECFNVLKKTYEFL